MASTVIDVVYEAVAHPARRRMLDLLAVRDRSAGDLARPFRMSQPAISQHLRVLRQAKLVRARRDGRRRLYRLNPAPLQRLHDWSGRCAKIGDPSGHVWSLRGPSGKISVPTGGAMPPLDLIIRKFDSRDEVRTFEKSRFELVKIGGMTIGRARYEPGWKWSTHVAPAAGTKSCQVEHVGMVLSGACAVKMDDGRLIEMHAGEMFYIGPGHDSWVVGDEPYVSLHFMGADQYARK